MDQDLRSRIQAAAQDRGLDPDTLIRFAQAESSLNPNAKAKTSSAKGLFQVINKTWKEYGGGDKNNIDEQIRVGADVVASNQASFKRKFNREPSAAELYAYHVLGPTGAPQLLKADPNTPMDQVVSREAYKANPNWHGKKVGDILATYEKKVGGSQTPQASTEQRNTQMRPTNYSFEPLTQMDLDNLGPNYQAGMAAMALGDTQDDDEDNIAERAQEAREDAENSMLADSGSQNVANLEFSYASPFPQEEQPVMMARGGEARKMLNAVYRADGSPEYGEISMGDFSDPKAGRDIMKNIKMPTREDAKYLARIPKEGVSNTESFIRGSLAAIPGSVGDIEEAFRNPRADSQAFPTKSGVEGRKQTVFPTTERILESVPRVTKANERSAGFEDIGTYDMGVAAAPIGKVLAKGAKVAAPVVAEAMANSTVPKLLKPALQPELLEPMYAVKPSGGVFYPKGSGSNVDAYLENIVKTLGKTDIPGKSAGTVADFIRNKGHKYLTTTYATGKDPIREAVMEGRLTLTGKDTDVIRDYALAAAREGNPNALKDVEKAYDSLTKLRGDVIIKDKDITTMAREGKMDVAQEAEVARMLKEGVDPDQINYMRNTRYVDDLGKSYAPPAHNMLGELIAGTKQAETGGQKAVQMAADKGERIYDITYGSPDFEFLQPKVVAEGIATIPIKDLERMSFPEAVIRGAQNTLLDRSADAVVTALENGKSIPKKFYAEGITPVKGAEDLGWVTVDTPFAVKLEGASMKHSVAGYAEKGKYGHGGRDAFLEGKAKVYSLRPNGGKPSVTVEARVDPEGLYVSQVKGPYNSEPTLEEKAKVFQLFDVLRPHKFQAQSIPEKYRNTRTGQSLKEDQYTTVNWAEEYANYQKYLNKEIE